MRFRAARWQKIYSHGVDEEALKKLQAKCTDEVKRINGAVTFEDAYRFQNE